ncbi:uncharacterized protein [Clytia hemisphaerica]|uniref:uncharacterized protein n=1 Tax=Clytia hemisphaerica TaxID=252671 RepID=UPI0034D48084
MGALDKNGFSAIKKILFNWLQILFNFINSLWQKPTDEYENSASVYKIIHRYKEEFTYSKKNDFLILFTEFSHPNIVLAENYSLYTFTDDEAIFVDCGDCDIFDKTKAFVYDTQYKNAVKMVTMPLHSFHLVAKQVNVPKIPIIHLANHGRCGSTLLTKVFDAIPGALSISETNGFSDVVLLSHNGNKNRETLKKLCLSVILMTIKHGNTRNSTCIFIKLKNYALFLVDIMVEVLPSMKQVYMYRQGIGFVRSWEKLFIANDWKPLPTHIHKLICGIGKHRLMKDSLQRIESVNLEDLSHFAKIALIWIFSAVAYERLLQSDLKMKSLKYEHLVANPKKVLTNFFEFVELPLDQLPDIEDAFSNDSQQDTPFSSRHVDKEKLKLGLAPITDELKIEVENLCEMFDVPRFWDNVVLKNDL